MPLIFLSDIDLIKEAYVTKGDIISDRLAAPSTNLIGTSLGRRNGIADANYNKSFRQRKMLALSSMKDFGLAGKSLDVRIMEESRFLNDQLKEVADMNKPTDVLQRLLYLAVANVIYSVVFGHAVWLSLSTLCLAVFGCVLGADGLLVFSCLGLLVGR